MGSRRPQEVQRLLGELETALDREAALAAILQVLSRSPKDAQPVFDMIAESAARLCNAQFCFVYRFDGQLLHFAAHHGLPDEALEVMHRSFPMPPGRGSAGARAVLSGAVVYIPNVDTDPDFKLGALSDLIETRAALAVPMLQNGKVLGAISVAIEPTPTGTAPEQQTKLLRAFAEQAVIAIENMRLFDEVQARTRELEERTRELTESLEQQTAASEILRVIARSPTDVQPVFDTIATSVARLCGARFCIVFRFDGELVHFVAQHGLPPEGIAGNQQNFPMPPGRGSAAARSILSRTVEQIPDVEADPDFAHASISVTRAVKVRSLLAVPMLKGDVPAGAIVVALENGAEALLTKPIDFVSLRETIETRVGKAA